VASLTEALKEHSQFLAVLREQKGIESLLAHSQETLDTGSSQDNMTVFTIGVQDERLNNGRETTIPSFWNGKPRDRETSIRNALASGRKWPSGDSVEEADFIDKYAHVAIEKQRPVGE